MIHLDPDAENDDENVAPAGRRTFSPEPWIGRIPCTDGVVDATQFHGGASALRRHRHQHGQHQQPKPSYSGSGSAVPQSPARDQGAAPLRGAASTAKTKIQQQRSSNRRRQRGRSPPQNATPAAPPAPERRRLATKLKLHYVHVVDRGLPILPLPEQPPEGEEPANLTTARCFARCRPKVASLYCGRGEDKLQDAFLARLTTEIQFCQVFS